jgi:hypothetical protein
MDAMVVEALKVGAVPAAGGVVALAAARLVSPERRVVAAATLMLATYVVAHGLIAGWPKIPPARALQVLPLLGVGALLLAWAGGGGRGVVARAVVAAATVWLLLGRLGGWESGERALWLGSTGLVLWMLLGSATKGARTVETLGALALVIGGAAGSAMLNHSAKLAELGGALAVSLAVVAVATWWRPCKHLAAGATTVGATLLGALLVYDQHYVEVPLAETLLLVAGWATLLLPRLPGGGGERKAMVRRALVAALPVIAALVLGFVRRQAAGESSYY